MGNVCPLICTVLLLDLCVLLCHVADIGCEKILGEENEEFDFDGLPGAQHEFKVYIPGAYEDCFFQPVAVGAQLHVKYEVLKGETYVDFIVRDPHWQTIETQEYKSHGEYTVENPVGGSYAVCLYNGHSTFGSSLVYVYMITFVMHEWIQFQQEIGEVNVLAANFSRSLNSVQEMVSAMLDFQAKARFNVVKDYYLLIGNNSYVLKWSLAQCILIVAAAVIQVYSVRRLFRTVHVTPTTAKPRA